MSKRNPAVGLVYCWITKRQSLFLAAILELLAVLVTWLARRILQLPASGMTHEQLFPLRSILTPEWVLQGIYLSR